MPKNRWARILVSLLVLVAAVLLVKHTRHHVFPKRFREVEPGLYRSGQMERGPYEGVVERYGIRSVLRLNAMSPEKAHYRIEADVVREHGLELHEIPMVGDGHGSWDEYERAADWIADPARRPLLFHCSAGEMRSSAVQAVYRMRNCGWTWEQAARELEEKTGPSRRRNPWLYVYLESYYKHRILASKDGKGTGAPPADPGKGRP